MPLQTPTVGIQLPDTAQSLSGLGSEAINLVQANQQSPGQVAQEQDLITSQIPAAQTARTQQMADLVSKAQIRRNTRALFPKDATEFQLNLAQRYQEVTGRMPPINAQTGQVDFGAMNQEMARLADQQMELQRQKVLGTRGAGQATAAQVVSAQDAIAAADAQLDKVGRVRAILKSGMNAVGPLRGSTVGKLAATGQAIAGSEGVYNAQRELEMWKNELVISLSEKMKGQLSDKDVRFLVQSVPKLEDTEEVWNRFADNYELALNTAKKNAELRASGRLFGEPPPVLSTGGGQAATQPAAAAVAPAELTDDQVARGRFVLNPDDTVVFEVDGVRVPGTPELAQRASALQTAAAPVTDTLESMIGRVPILPAAGGLSASGSITPAKWDRNAFEASRLGDLTVGR